MLVIFSITASVLYILDNQTLAAISYSENIGGYEAAVSGIMHARDCMQNILDENRRLIDEKVINEILSAPTNTISFYSANPGNSYGGEFRLKIPVNEALPDDSRCLYQHLFLKYAKAVLNDALADGCRLNISYQKESASVSYLVTVEINEALGDRFRLKAFAVNEKNGALDTALAFVELSPCDGAVFTEKYPLDDIPLYLSAGVYSRGELVNISSSFAASPALFGQDAQPPGESFYGLSSKNVVLAQDGHFDISLYHNEGGASPAAVVYEGTGDLVITASDAGHNYFEGIIISYGGIKLENTAAVITGQVYCANDLTLINSSLNVAYKNTLPEMVFDSQPEKREFLHKLGVINFNFVTSTLSGFKIGALKTSCPLRLEIKSLKKAA